MNHNSNVLWSNQRWHRPRKAGTRFFEIKERRHITTKSRAHGTKRAHSAPTQTSPNKSPKSKASLKAKWTDLCKTEGTRLDAKRTTKVIASELHLHLLVPHEPCAERPLVGAAFRIIFDEVRAQNNKIWPRARDSNVGQVTHFNKHVKNYVGKIHRVLGVVTVKQD